MLQLVAKFPYIGGLPRDCSEQTFHFSTFGADATATEITDAITDLTLFYNQENGGNFSLAAHMPDYIDRTMSVFLLSNRDIVTGVQNGPTIVVGWTPDPSYPAGTAVGLPAEVALCLSYKTTIPAVNAGGRARGRVYLGPFHSGDFGSDAAYSRPADGLVNAALLAGSHLITNTNTHTIPWGVWSRANGQLVPIESGWVDNEWDTQRRRGKDATARTTFVEF